eukprot:Nk52_evm1s249 gene=Nk52_evmTU1s249
MQFWNRTTDTYHDIVTEDTKLVHESNFWKEYEVTLRITHYEQSQHITGQFAIDYRQNYFLVLDWSKDDQGPVWTPQITQFTAIYEGPCPQAGC